MKKYAPETMAQTPDSLLKRKYNLLTKGVAWSDSMRGEAKSMRYPEMVHLELNKKITVSPLIVSHSEAYGFITKDGDRHFIQSNDETFQISIKPPTFFTDIKAPSGRAFGDVGTMPLDRLRVSVFKGCKYVAQERGCHFCEVNRKSDVWQNSLEDIEALVKLCVEDEQSTMRHVLVSGGCPPVNEEYRYIDVVRKVRKHTNLPIYVMMEPPRSLDCISDLYDSGVSEIGFNVEIYDRSLARNIMPGKGLISLDKYWKSLERAVSLFGGNGAVRSLLIVGLEPVKSTLSGVRELAQRGVMPILAPFRPMHSTYLAERTPLETKTAFYVWQEANSICEEYEMHLGPRCIACQNNVLAYPNHEYYRTY